MPFEYSDPDLAEKLEQQRKLQLFLSNLADPTATAQIKAGRPGYQYPSRHIRSMPPNLLGCYSKSENDAYSEAAEKVNDDDRRIGRVR